ncbi:MAG: 2-iminoacetate synthase ThiH [Terrimicrobiaceae bacterium]|nr:2-iminoacetate synthase ThiH [Terrimicrobiaceae bacterium]
MGFSDVFDRSLREKSPLLRSFEALLRPMERREIEVLAAKSTAVTRRHFGRTMRLFAPLYLSNECINSCTYCGFSRENAIQRVTLEVDQVECEARHLVAEGFRSILLVAGEHPKFVSGDYLRLCVERLRTFVPSLSIEVAPMEAPDYRPIVEAGAEGLVVYQETYDRARYAELHLFGPKKDFNWRLDTPERGHEAGFRRIGIGALFGLSPWRNEALALAAHLEHLLKTCWKSQLTVSLPRMRPAAGEFTPPFSLPDRDFIQLLCALRITFPTVGIVVSTREPAALRDAVAPLGVTMMSAGSHTEPGGYTGQGKDALHLTVRGKPVAGTGGESATEQFLISDDRDAATVGRTLAGLGLDPVWKDWDAGILTDSVGNA